MGEVETAIFCDLWFPAVFCSFLQFSKPLTLQIKDQICKKSAKVFDMLPFLPFSL